MNDERLDLGFIQRCLTPKENRQKSSKLNWTHKISENYKWQYNN
jgi:hypothetical protein